MNNGRNLFSIISFLASLTSFSRDFKNTYKGLQSHAILNIVHTLYIPNTNYDNVNLTRRGFKM